MLWRRLLLAFLPAFVFVTSSVFGDGPADNTPENVRRVPKRGIEVPADRRESLQAGLQQLQQSIDQLRQQNSPKLAGLLPDVQIFHKAVHDALAYQEFFDPKELDYAQQLVATGQERADQLLAGQSPWTSATGLVVRGYVSKIDGSVQPYGLVIPENFQPKGADKWRLDVWFHGRGENLSELNFLRDRSTNAGTFTPADTIVLHPYGRYCNAFKFAGEVDVLEGIDSVRSRYRIEDDRISVRGFSMGGAAAWHFGVHYPERWFAANPGAGFSETPDFLKVFQKEELRPMPWEKTLWHWYDCTDWAANLRHCPVVAYSGELDSQKQAADVMEKALKAECIDLLHVIGPQTKHAYEPKARLEVEERMTSLARNGRDWQPLDLELVTYTLKYNKMHWLTVDELKEHWQKARVVAALLSGQMQIEPENVTDFTLDFPAGECPFDVQSPVVVVIGDQELTAPQPKSDRSWNVSFHQVRDEWRLGKRPAEEGGLRKKHDLQGPVDDAFMDSFIFVRPTGQPWHKQAGQWSDGELSRAIEHWRRHFRGDAQVKNDVDITDVDIASSNLVLWGDPQSNTVLARIAKRLPISWTQQEIVAGEQRFPAANHALIAIHPNPLNPNRYVVLNSSFTFRDYAYLNNARQVPMLPDWAVVDLTTPPGAVWPGKIVAADFFDERWQLKPSVPSSP
jgi:pimeloyl-ACP methyl ester carboxylesterase